jgi:peroxiredoxin
VVNRRSLRCHQMAANPLTGAYEAVVHVAARQIDGLLATLHQNGAAAEASLKLLHSVRVGVGGRRRRPDLDEFGDWVVGFYRRGSPVPASDFRGQLIDAAPPGAAARITETFGALDDPLVLEGVPDVVRGQAEVQVSTVTISVPQGSTSEVTIHAHIRAHYSPAAGTTDLPRPIHGAVEATFEIRRVQWEWPSGRRFPKRLVIRPSHDDAKIVFHPAPGSLNPGEAAQIAAQIRRALRNEFTLVPVDLPAEFPFDEFKGVGAGAGQAIALGLQLSGAGPPAGGLASVTQSLVGPSGFAFAVSKQFVIDVFQPTLDDLRNFKRSFEVDIPGPNPTYDFSVTDARLLFDDGAMELRIEGKATHPVLPDFDNIVIRQRFTLAMFLETLFIAALDDELTISGLTIDVPWHNIDLPTGRVKSAIIRERNRVLPGAQAGLNSQLAAARTRVNEALRRFDDSASLSLRSGHSEEPGAASSGAIAITPDGIIVRGDFRLSPRPMPVADVHETNDETAFTAFESWVPAGRIERLIWSWVDYSGPSPWSGVSKSLSQEHHFILPKPPGVTDRNQMCLQLEGTQIGTNGAPISIVGGTSCLMPEPGVIMNVPSWWEPVMVPLWRPDIRDDAVVRDALIAHVTVQADTAGRDDLTHNSIVCFPDWQADAPLRPLREAFEQMQRRGASVVVFVVLPAGEFDARRRELEAKLASIGEHFSANLHVTEDDEGGWTKTFAASRRPAVFLINARRRFVWKYEGAPDARELASALDRRLQAAPAPRSLPLRLTVSPGDRAPDAEFHDDRGQLVALHRLRGRPVLLNFSQLWSAPCLKELRHLQTQQDRSAREGPVVLALHGGRQINLEPMRRELALTFPLAQDVEQQVARKYGVRCWPTTVRIDPDGRIEHVQFGVTHHDERYQAPRPGRAEERAS